MISAHNSSDFKIYRQKAVKALHRIAEEHSDKRLDELAVPAYLQGVWLSRWVFWKRINIVSKYIFECGGGDACLDFGCGSGVALPLLMTSFRMVYAVDVMPHVSEGFIRHFKDDRFKFSDNVTYSSSLDDASIPDASLDLIIALDSLEHVANYEYYLLRMQKLLRSGGNIIICGPTENWLYRRGRQFIGFSGHYHCCSIYDIEKDVRKLFKIESMRRLTYPFPLFIIIKATKF